MESPPSSSSWSQGFILSDDSGLLLTNGSASSGSTSFERRRQFHFEDSDCEERSLSQDDSLDGMSDVMCGENFNTLKKGPPQHWTDLRSTVFSIEPPLEFQDKPRYTFIEIFCDKLSTEILKRAFMDFREGETKKIRLLNQLHRPLQHLLNRPYFTSDFIPFSPCHHNGRPSSRSSLGSSRLSSSHNSLSVLSAHKLDDSTFITQAVSHDTLSTNQRCDLYNVPNGSSDLYNVPLSPTSGIYEISDLYNVPFDSDMYAVPVDVVVPSSIRGNSRRVPQSTKKRRRNTSSGCRDLEVRNFRSGTTKKSVVGLKYERSHWSIQNDSKRHSVAGSSAPIPEGEPIHMTLQEVRHYLQTLYSSSDSSDAKERIYKPKANCYHHQQHNVVDISFVHNNNNKLTNNTNSSNKDGGEVNGVLLSGAKSNNNSNNNCLVNKKNNTFLINIKNKKVKDSCDNGIGSQNINISSNNNTSKNCGLSPVRKEADNGVKRKKTSSTRLFSLKQTLCNMFRFRKYPTVTTHQSNNKSVEKLTYSSTSNLDLDIRNNLSSRALPPLPNKEQATADVAEQQILDFATSIQRVKDYGWYWGPISGEAAEKILSNEPDGSFIVRDSSDDHYIFSLTFKLNNYVRHVRIEHDQGNFSFGSCTKFKSQTIVEFIENAVEHSRSGRYLFFLHRRPVIGPVRVQLLHPVSRFKQVQSLQHMCRFVIHKNVRRDLIPQLPLPRRMIDYLNTPHYYSEHFVDMSSSTEDIELVDNSTTPSPLLQPIVENNDDVIHDVQSNDLNVPVVNDYGILNNNNNCNAGRRS